MLHPMLPMLHAMLPNFAESYFSLLKRGIIGTFHHVSEEHMPRYLDEFNYRWSRRDQGDGERTAEAIKGFAGKRLLYRDSLGSAEQN